MAYSIFHDDHHRDNNSFHFSPHLVTTNMRRTRPAMIHLNLHTSDNHLTLKIIRVRGIQIYSTHLLIKITFIPDIKPLECHTRTVPNLHGTGIFNEKLTFEINDDDIDKRLCLSIYTYSPSTDLMDNQGCLSFGIRNTLRKQKIHAWFYILPEDIGEYRHKQVTNQDERSVTKINRDIANLEEHQFTIPRGSNDSFGFTVVGDSPTFIGKITENSSAAVCGLKIGDFLVKINGLNVSRAQQRTVTNLIKRSKHSITMDIYRYPSRHSLSYESSTSSDLSMSHRPFVDLAQLGYNHRSKSIIRSTSIDRGFDSSICAIKGSPTTRYL